MSEDGPQLGVVVVDQYHPRISYLEETLSDDARVFTFDISFESGDQGYESRGEWYDDIVEKACLRIGQLMKQCELTCVVFSGEAGTFTSLLSDLQEFIQDDPELIARQERLRRILFSCWGEKPLRKMRQRGVPTDEIDKVIPYDRKDLEGSCEKLRRELLQ